MGSTPAYRLFPSFIMLWLASAPTPLISIDVDSAFPQDEVACSAGQQDSSVKTSSPKSRRMMS